MAEAVTPDAAAAPRQFVIFCVAGERFAVPLAHVNEIIRYPAIVHVPLGAPSLEGLSNLRGAVLPVLNLRRIIGVADAGQTEATRVVVLDTHGRAFGVVVDRMANVVTVEPDRIEAVAGSRSTIATDLLTGLIKDRADGSIVMILDVHRLLAQGDGLAIGEGAAGIAEAAAAAVPSADADEVVLVSFLVANAEYALPIERVEEIVAMPPAITVVPNAGAHVLGVITLRDRLLPLVSLRRMLKLAEAEPGEAGKILVVALGAGVSAGLVMDDVREVLRIGAAVIDALPPIVARPPASHQIASICRLNGGTRLVSVLSLERLFDAGDVREMEETARAGGGAPAQADAADAPADEEEQLVVFRVMDEEYGVPIAAVHEILRVPDTLVRLPDTPDVVEGVVDLRGSVLPILDARRRFGLPAAEGNDRRRIIVFSAGGVRTGFIVDSITHVLRVRVSAIGPAPALSRAQLQLIRRVVNLTAQRRMILLLDVDALLDGERDEPAAVAA